MDWNAIIIEYVTTDTSYRKLAEKYNVSATQVTKHAIDEKWLAEKKRFLSKTYTQTLSALSDGHTKRAMRILSISDRILDKMERAVNLLEETDLHAFKQMTAILKDIKEIQLIKDEGEGSREMCITVKGWDPSWGE